ncbi:hypothetical protein JCGZ_10844 [Jatropha curcas]|uniref:Uncharacterized protein n=1 Tax=Jatropha curcas TaxID=180498 RepID=A0A067KVB1_JATCU|nr:hypothetical protein JCGZ_10844 [Jatropha curcas]
MTSSNNSTGLGFMAAFAVSGSVLLIARHVHKRSKRCEGKKRVRFADDVIEPSGNNKHLSKIAEGSGSGGHVINNYMQSYSAKLLEDMPLNRQILYKGIIEYKALKGYNI